MLKIFPYTHSLLPAGTIVSILSLSFLVTLAPSRMNMIYGAQLVISSKSLDRCGGQASFWAIKSMCSECPKGADMNMCILTEGTRVLGVDA